MIKVYEDNSIYVGEMVSNQRCGKGTLYFLEDIFCGCKVSGNWQNDKLHGWVEITTKQYAEKGVFDNGVKTGSFHRYYKDGRCSDVKYDNGKNILEVIYSRGNKKPYNNFGNINLTEDTYYLGDIFDGLPFGYGMIYNLDAEKKIIKRTFCEIYGHQIVQCIEINKKVQENENNLGG